MRIRHRQRHDDIIDAIGEGVINEVPVYLADWQTDGQVKVRAFSKETYEPIPTETWEDVTGRLTCDGVNLLLPTHDGTAFVVGITNSQYRLVSERLWRRVPNVAYPDRGRYEPVEALRVERKR